jgi:hypothetical protein
VGQFDDDRRKRELGVGEHHEDDPAKSGDGKAKTVIQTQKKKKKGFEPQQDLHALEDSVDPLVAVAPLLDLGLPPKSSLMGEIGESSTSPFPSSLSDPMIDNARLLFLLVLFSVRCLALAVFFPRRALGKRSIGGQCVVGE